MSRVRILSARRSAIAPRGGALADQSVEALGAPVLRAALEDSGLVPGDVDDVILANSLGAGGNPARIVALHAGLPHRVPGLSIDRQCAGGLDALVLGAALIRTGHCRVVVAGGVESYSRRPLRYRTFADGRAPEAYDQAPFTPWPDRDPPMAEAADILAHTLGIDREEQDAWAIESHRKALAHRDMGEIVEIAGLRHDTFTRALSARHCRMAPVVTGSITAANAAVAADGAAFVVMACDSVGNASDHAVEFCGGLTRGGDPAMPGTAPIAAVRAVLDAAGIGADDLSVFEIMEAFAVQAIACQQGCGIPQAITNPGGGALARGHPIGASGAVLAVRLFHELRQRGGYGLAAIAAAGGLGTAALLRRV